MNIQEVKVHPGAASRWEPITPNDDTPLPWPVRGIYCDGEGGAGNVVLMDRQGNTITVPITPGEVRSEFSPYIVMNTGTTATGLYALLD